MDEYEKANQLRKIGNYSRAVDVYQPLWAEDNQAFDNWTGWSYAFCLIKSGKYQEALEISRALYRRFNQEEIIASIYAQSIYYTQFKTKYPPVAEVQKKALKAMFILSPPDKKYSFTPHAVFRYAKNLMNEIEVDWKEIEFWMEKLKPELLSDQPFVFQDKKGKQSSQASALENWYSNMIKVKGALNQPEALLELVEEARSKKLKWHYDNDLWFARKEAFAHLQLGNREVAENILRKIILRKKDWFLLYDLAKTLENRDEALQLMCTAALAPGKITMKLKLYESIYNIVKETDEESSIPALHLYLITALREENGWSVQGWMNEEIKKAGMDVEKEGSSSATIHKLMPFWMKKKGEEENVRLKGQIMNILPNGSTGFIKFGKKSYYAHFGKLTGDITIGTLVEFELKDSFDKKKNKASKMAIKLKIAE